MQITTSLGEVASRLIEFALKRGSTDNLSVIIIDLQSGRCSPPPPQRCVVVVTLTLFALRLVATSPLSLSVHVRVRLMCCRKRTRAYSTIATAADGTLPGWNGMAHLHVCTSQTCVSAPSSHVQKSANCTAANCNQLQLQLHQLHQLHQLTVRLRVFFALVLSCAADTMCAQRGLSGRCTPF